MAIDDLDFTEQDVQSRLAGLFERAKSTDEFEFGCTLLRVRGMESAGWDPFVETQLLAEDLTTLLTAPLVVHTKVRLALLLYSHLTEVKAVYEVLANLMRVVGGERYVMDPFLDAYPRNRKNELQFLSTTGRVKALKEMLGGDKQEDVSELLDWVFQPSVRNAFAHADYTLHKDEFRSRGEQFAVKGIISSSLPFEVLTDIVNRALMFYGGFMEQYEQQRGGYTTNKVVLGRFAGGPDPEPVELLGDAERGLYGFRSPPQPGE